MDFTSFKTKYLPRRSELLKTLLLILVFMVPAYLFMDHRDQICLRYFSIRTFILLLVLFALSAALHINKKRQLNLTGTAYIRSLIFGSGNADAAASSRIGNHGAGSSSIAFHSAASPRIAYLDWLRAFVTVMVVLTHCISSGLIKMELSATRSLLDVLAHLFHCCNLLFIMLSGALILRPARKELTPLAFYAKRFLRVLIPAVVYFVFYDYYIKGLATLRPSNWMYLLRGFLANDTGQTPHFWLIHIVLMMYISAPVFKLAIKNISERMLDELVLVILVLHTVFTYVPVLIGTAFSVTTFLASWESVFLLGYYCTTDSALKRYKLFMAGGALSAVFIVFAVCFLQDPDLLVYNNATPMVLLSCAVFLWFRRHGDSLFSRMPAIVALISHSSFSILLIHWLVMFRLVEMELGISALSFGIIGGIPVSVGLTLILSMCFAVYIDNTIVFILNFIAGFRGNKK